MKYLAIILSITIIISCVFIVYLIIYRKLRSIYYKLIEANKLMLETLNKKYNLLLRLSNIIKNSLNLEANYFKDIKGLKIKSLTNYELDDKLDEFYETIIKIKNDYTELEQDENLNDLLNQLNDTNEKLESIKFFYNKYNKILLKNNQHFLNNFVAKIKKINITQMYSIKKTEE